MEMMNTPANLEGCLSQGTSALVAKEKVPDGPSPTFPNPKLDRESQTTLPSANEEREKEKSYRCVFRAMSLTAVTAAVTGVTTHTVVTTVEIIREVMVEVTVKDTAEVTEEDMGEVTMKDTAEVTVKDTAEVTVKDTAEVTVKDTAEVTVKDTAEVTTTDTAEVTVEDMAEVTVEDMAEVTVVYTEKAIMDLLILGIRTNSTENTSETSNDLHSCEGNSCSCRLRTLQMAIKPWRSRGARGVVEVAMMTVICQPSFVAEGGRLLGVVRARLMCVPCQPEHPTIHDKRKIHYGRETMGLARTEKEEVMKFTLILCVLAMIMALALGSGDTHDTGHAADAHGDAHAADGHGDAHGEEHGSGASPLTLASTLFSFVVLSTLSKLR
ncbi:hypothetical protein C0Q70_03828 [Pomacea canaliculata]|uniref:Uncharacterized protein n=1 Tax=Pomacea canaliculata TaxID=400727 RepID=A0A2T7PTT9_POMCA|nr:hypothetical protein C0Q70_03828 [Pomacea canaliculata]